MGHPHRRHFVVKRFGWTENLEVLLVVRVTTLHVRNTFRARSGRTRVARDPRNSTLILETAVRGVTLNVTYGTAEGSILL